MPPSSRLLTALRLLADGYGYAHDLGAPLTDFAISMETMRRNSVAEIDIRWLILKRYALVHDDSGTEASVSIDDFPLQASFVVSDEGLRFAQEMLATSITTEVPSAVLPSWEESRRELRLGVKIVKRFRVPACNQETVLRTFQAQGWPPHLLDPLPLKHEIDPKRRLHDTILALNRGQSEQRIRFRGDGTGIGVYWELET